MKFRKGNKIPYSQDFQYRLRGLPHSVDFRVKLINKRMIELRGDGYGNLKKPNCYGNGSILVYKSQLTKRQWQRIIDGR